MVASGFFFPTIFPLCFFFLLLSQTCLSSFQNTSISTGFEATQMTYIDNDGLFLYSNGSDFFFGFRTLDGNKTAFLLVVVHKPSSRVVWTANRGSPVGNSDKFVFGEDGEARLMSQGGVIWSTKTGGSGAAVMKLLDNGNLVILPKNGSANPVWQSFDHPTDTLLPEQTFRDGMSLVSDKGAAGLRYSLRISSGDMKLQVEFRKPQPYWSFSTDTRTIKDSGNGDIVAARIRNNSWNVYDSKSSLLSRFIISGFTVDGTRWAVVLGKDGIIKFFDIGGSRRGDGRGKDVIPKQRCDVPNPCGPYYMCSASFRCNCPAAIGSHGACKPDIGSPCGGTATELVEVKENVGYFAVGFLPPTAKGSNITSCKASCEKNCSCLALFFEESSTDCYLFDEIGSLQRTNAKKYTCFLRISSSGGGNGGRGGEGRKPVAVIVSMSVLTVGIVASVVYAAVVFYKRRRKEVPEPALPLVSSDEDDFLETMPGMPVRFSYQELQEATNNFSVKLGRGGFGSVYLGKLPDGSRIAVKKLEGIGQGKKEFRAEVSIIGSIHHVHLVRLRGFCAESTHRLLAYEFMANGSLDRLIFRKNQEDLLLDWDKRFSVALGTAKGLAYLHEDCDSKIVHCDIKPENVLLDENFLAKVSDFGLAKLMTREQSHVFTTLRGTRGYLAPEWIINSAISEKSDVYSFGMVLLEIIGGRKNFDPTVSSEKAHFPSYAFKKLEEGKLKEVLDESLRSGDKDERVEVAVKVALWCIQEDVSLRPSMTKVVQMLEGVTDVPLPPVSGQMGFRLYANMFKTISEEASTSWEAPSSGCNSDAFLSAVRLSGPR